MSRIAIIKTTTFLMFLGGNLLGGLALAHDSEDYLNDAIPGPVAESFWSMFLADAHAAGKVSIKRKGDYRYIESDGLPDHATGRFPNSHNPHTISEQAHKFRVPLKPEKRRSPGSAGPPTRGRGSARASPAPPWCCSRPRSSRPPCGPGCSGR